MRLTELHVEGYHCLADATLPLRPLTVMIGPNGSGKSSTLDIFLLLRDAMQEKLADGLVARGGFNAVLTRLERGAERLKVRLTADVESPRSPNPMYYAVELAPTQVGYTVNLERLEWHFAEDRSDPFYYINSQAGRVFYRGPDTPDAQPAWDYKRSELALAQVPRLYVEPETLRALLARMDFYSFLDVGRRAVVRLPQALTPVGRPGPNGENLFSALYNLRSKHRRVYGRILDVLRLAFPGFQELDFPVVGAGQVNLAWHSEPLTAPLYPGDLSEGTLRFLWLVTVLLSPEPAPLTLIDEPEVSLHPELLRLLAGLLQDASLRSTVLVATHSTDLIRWLQPNEVVVIDKDAGASHFTWADQMNLEEWLKEYSLSDLWLMGTLGGRP